MRCPVCKADNTQGLNCRRCKADLGLLFTLEERRRQLLDAARQRLSDGDWSVARAAAAQADRLQSDDESRRFLAVVHLLAGDFATAWGRYCQACAANRPNNATPGS